MQSTLPLFDATLAISDVEFAALAGLTIAGGVGLASFGSGGLWLLYAGASATPLGLLFAGGAAAAMFGGAAIRQSMKWGNKQQTDRKTIVLTLSAWPLTISQLLVCSWGSRRRLKNAAATCYILAL